MYKEYQSDLAVCQELQKKHGRHAYYFSTLLLPREQREATFILYAFFRLPDECVDQVANEQDKDGFYEWRGLWEKVKREERVEHPVMRAVDYVHKKYRIPFSYGDHFLDAMEQDFSKTRYDTYADLKEYMYGSASCVGLMMSYVLGYDEGALPYAEKLGEAMQYTNFLRDIGEDYDDLQRIYIPQGVLSRHKVTEEMIKKKHVTSEFVSMMKNELKRARNLFEEANAGIHMLHTGRYGVRVASTLYESIIDSIEKNNYDVLTRQAKVPFIRKLVVAVKTYVTK